MELDDKIIKGYEYELKLLSNKLETCSNIHTRDEIKEQMEIMKTILNYFDKEQ